MKNERVGKGKDAEIDEDAAGGGEHVSVSAANDDRSPVLRRNSDRAQCSAVKDLARVVSSMLRVSRNRH